jgi:hypothetical protein
MFLLREAELFASSDMEKVSQALPCFHLTEVQRKLRDPVLRRKSPSQWFTTPLDRARETCELAGAATVHMSRPIGWKLA